jgi:hypothetical protein
MASVGALPRSFRSRGSVKDVPEQNGKDVMKLNTNTARAWGTRGVEVEDRVSKWELGWGTRLPSLIAPPVSPSESYPLHVSLGKA